VSRKIVDERSGYPAKSSTKGGHPIPGWNCITHPQALQDFPDMSQVPLHKNNKINLPVLQQFLPGAGK
jgi:hypothetical protein